MTANILCVQTGSSRERYKSPSYQIKEGECVNVDVTGPGATMALGLMFFNTNNRYGITSFTCPTGTELRYLPVPTGMELRHLPVPTGMELRHLPVQRVPNYVIYLSQQVWNYVIYLSQQVWNYVIYLSNRYGITSFTCPTGTELHHLPVQQVWNYVIYQQVWNYEIYLSQQVWNYVIYLSIEIAHQQFDEKFMVETLRLLISAPS